MSGILDNKSRVMDTIVTFEGRRQIANADLKIEYVSFSDASTFYKADLVSGSVDATNRLYFEACNLPQDCLTFEADDSGNLQAFPNLESTIIKNGNILNHLLTGSTQNMTILQGDDFASTADSLLQSSIQNFNNLRIIGTKDSLFEDDGFAIGNSKFEFVITNSRPLSDSTNKVVNLKNIDSLMQDIRLRHLPNFKFLPPINKVNNTSIDKSDLSQVKPYKLGNYKLLTSLTNLTPSQLENELSFYEIQGCSKVISFEPTSNNNRLVIQFFETSYDTMKKLDVIDFGNYVYNEQYKHAFFVGKVMTDSNETHTFIHLFTLIFG